MRKECLDENNSKCKISDSHKSDWADEGESQNMKQNCKVHAVQTLETTIHVASTHHQVVFESIMQSNF